MNIKLILAQLRNIRSEELIYFSNFQYSSHPGLNVSDHEVAKKEYCQPRTQACSRYPSEQRRLGTERDSARRPGRIFPTSLTGDVTSEIAEDDWERGWSIATPFPPPPDGMLVDRRVIPQQYVAKLLGEEGQSGVKFLV